jgi:hypothetical protein
VILFVNGKRGSLGGEIDREVVGEEKRQRGEGSDAVFLGRKKRSSNSCE